MVDVPASKMKAGLAAILKDQGYITDYERIDEGPQGVIRMRLRYVDGEPAMLEFPQRRGTGGAIERITCRIYLQRVPVDEGKDLVLIGLPDRETMHAFAITLEEP